MIFNPSLLVAEIFYPVSGNYDEILNIVDLAADTDFYKTIETGIFLDKDKRNLLRAKVESCQLNLTQWATFVILDERLALASTDTSVRHRSINRMLELIDIAADSGASTLALTSGDDPGVCLREDAKKRLADTFRLMCEHAQQYNGMNIVIEHLDRYAHKRQLLGPVDETVQWITGIRETFSNLYLGWDAAHAALNGENLFTTLKTAAPVMKNLHLSNAVLDPTDELYGDRHIRFGRPGFLTEEFAKKLVSSLLPELDPHASQKINIAVEMRSATIKDMFANEKDARLFLANVVNNLNP